MATYTKVQKVIANFDSTLATCVTAQDTAVAAALVQAAAVTGVDPNSIQVIPMAPFWDSAHYVYSSAVQYTVIS